MEKDIIDVRIEQMSAEGVTFRAGVDVGGQFGADRVVRDFDAVVLAMGARTPRDLVTPGRELGGVHFAMAFLEQQNRRIAGDTLDSSSAILATGKRVVVIGGGDTGSDCVGTSLRQGAVSVTQLELMPKPHLMRVPTNPWPEWPLVLRTSSSQEEGAERDWAVSTRGFRGEGGRVVGLDAVRVAFEGGRMRPVEGADLLIPCELVLLAMGFVGPERRGLVEDLGLALDARGNVRSDRSGLTSIPGVFAAGDVSRGQSLVVWAIADGRRVAAGVDAWLSRASAQRAAAG
jgi:glutamate synthase (NADPH/NADH) small chain